MQEPLMNAGRLALTPDRDQDPRARRPLMGPNEPSSDGARGEQKDHASSPAVPEPAAPRPAGRRGPWGRDAIPCLL
jgi:hypothetical protein